MRFRRALAALVVAVMATTTGARAAPAAEPEARPPVVMIVFDEFPLASLMRPDGSLDTDRFPGFASLAAGSTWFANAATVHDSTLEAVPAILDGRWPVPGDGRGTRGHPRSVFTTLRRRGYAMNAFESATALCPASACRRVPHYGAIEYNASNGRSQRLQRTIDSIRREHRPTFTFLHSILPHGHWIYRPDGKEQAPFPDKKTFEPSAPGGFDSPFLTAFDQQTHLLQVGYVDREIARLVRRLKAQGLWRKAVVVVTADHGIAFDLGAKDRRLVTRANMHEIAPVPLFFKRSGQTRGARSNVLARTIDILPTIAKQTGGDAPRVDGRDLFGAAVRRRRAVTIETRDTRGRITVPAATMLRERRVDWAQRARTFGTGSWRRVFDIGPDRHLVGTAAATYPPGEAGGLAADMVRPTGGIDRVRLEGSRLPFTSSGLISGGATGSVRDIALAVNGTIRSTGTSYRFREAPQLESWHLSIPERALRAGANEMALYEIQRVGLITRLAPLGRLR